MKNKIASIRVTHVFGTRSGVSVALMYRGREVGVKSAECHSSETGEMIQRMHKAALNLGFTNTRTVYA